MARSFGKKHSFPLSFAVIFFPATLVLIAGFLTYGWQVSSARIEALKSEEQRLVSLAQSAVSEDFIEITSDLLILADMPILKTYLLLPTEETRLTIGDEFLRYISAKRIYDQIRYIDLDGNEVVRVNFSGGTPTVTSEENLQNKADRYYVSEGLDLQRGQIFVSLFDLNREGGEVERPIKPVLRFVTPVFDLTGAKRGVVVVNYLGDTLLSRLRELMATSTGFPLIANKSGDWIIGPSPEDEWALDLEHDRSVVRQYPDLWKGLTALPKQAGGRLPTVLNTPDGLATAIRVYPVAEANQRIRSSARNASLVSTDLAVENLNWFLLTLVPTATIQMHTAALTPSFLALIFVLLLAVAVVSTLYALARRRQAEATENLQLVAKVTESTHNGVAIMDAQWRIISINHAFSAHTGFLPAEAEGRSVTWLLTGREQHDETVARIKGQVDADGRWEGEVLHPRRGGTSFPSDVFVCTVNDAYGTPRNYIEIFQDVSERHAYEQKLKGLAHHDALTGLPNRNLLEDRLERAWVDARRKGEKLALLYVDLDKFKPINDTYGHDAGDELLKSVALNMSRAVRETDTVARVGGDEFIVLLTHADSAEGVVTVAKSLIREVSRDVDFNGQALQVGASIGAAIYPDTAESIPDLMKKADEAMYAAKRTGSGHIKLYGEKTSRHFQAPEPSRNKDR